MSTISDAFDDVMDVVGAAAPLLATALVGPVGGVAVRAISQGLLGRDDGTEQEVLDAIRVATADDLIKLKGIEHEFALKMKEAGVTLERIASDDRDSARRRQASMRDWTPSFLGLAIIVGFFGVLVAIMFYDLPEGATEVFTVLLGALAALVTQVANYFFGSSAGSARKNEMIADLKSVAK